MCDPIDQIAARQIDLEAKEPAWMAILEARMERRARIMRMLAHRQFCDLEAYQTLEIRKEKAEAGQ